MMLPASPSDNRLTSLLGIRYPIMQAPLGGGISGAELAGAVSGAGGLGTLCLLPPDHMQSELAKTKAIGGGKPVAMNLLMPYVTRAHIEACVAARPDVVSLFFGFDRALVSRFRQAGIVVMHQVGSVEQSRRALEDGADALIVQGMEAGGHVIGREPLAEIVRSVRNQHPNIALFAAGGIVDAGDAVSAIAMGADGVCAGTRFLLTPESSAHDAYKDALLNARETMLTDLFGFGWTALHRVVSNRAIARWVKPNGMAPTWITVFNSVGALSRRWPIPEPRKQRVIASQRWSRPFFTPGSMTSAMTLASSSLAQSTALYAGEGVGRIKRLMTAAEVVSMFARAMENSPSH